MKTQTRWLFETPPTLETSSEINPYSASEFEEEWGQTELAPAPESELEGLVNSVFSKIGDAVDWGKAQVLVRKKILAGNRDENQLINLVFFARHPERQGRKLSKNEPNFQQLRQEWIEIRDRVVRPALTQITIPSSTLTTKIKWGVPGGIITESFHRNMQEKKQLDGRSSGRAIHNGIDVTGVLSDGKQNTVDDPRRGLPVYATIKPVISLDALNQVRSISKEGQGKTGLGIPGQGNAILKNALVLVQPWDPRNAKTGRDIISGWGGIIGLACRYTYRDLNGSQSTFTLYIEYLHLISEGFPPIDSNGNKFMGLAEWRAMGKPAGFGPRMQDKVILSAAELTGKNPLLVGYLGATVFPHVHINANYRKGEGGYQFFPRFDPTVMIT